MFVKIGLYFCRLILKWAHFQSKNYFTYFIKNLYSFWSTTLCSNFQTWGHANAHAHKVANCHFLASMKFANESDVYLSFANIVALWPQSLLSLRCLRLKWILIFHQKRCKFFLWVNERRSSANANFNKHTISKIEVLIKCYSTESSLNLIFWTEKKSESFDWFLTLKKKIGDFCWLVWKWTQFK